MIRVGEVTKLVLTDSVCELSLLFLLSLIICCDPLYDEGFSCGEPRGGDGIVQYCSGATEICVCATGSCAKQDRSCGSDYRYIERPFADEELAGNCVDIEDTDWIINSGASERVCSIPSVDGGLE